MYKSKTEIAKTYSQKGLSVFPVHGIENGCCTCGDVNCTNVGKHPLTDNGCKAATKDAEIIDRYFAGEYDVANVGIATGEVSGIWVVDVDAADAIERLTSEHGPLPSTPTVKTSKGTHYYFRLPEGVTVKNSQSRIAKGIDVRGEGGYVLAPPSVHKSGHVYTWAQSPDDTPFADAPDWLIKIAMSETNTLESSSVDDRVKAYLAKCPEAVSGERGHDVTFGTLCKLFDTFPELRERSDDDVMRMAETWNARCVPPWTQNELRHKIRDARTRTGAKAEGGSVDAHDDDNDNVRNEGVAAADADETAVEWPELNADALIGFAGEFVQRIEPHSEADPVALLLTLLNGFGSIVGRGPFFEAAGVRHHTNTNVCVVGQSSRARKGTSFGYVQNVFVGIDPSWNERRVNGLSSGEGVIAAVSANADESEGTIVIPDRRLWIVETEFGQTLKVLKRDGNTLSPVLRNAWDGGTLSILTKANPMRAENAHVAILSHVTVDELQRSLSDVETLNGFANRFLWILARRSKLLPHGGNVDVADLKDRLALITQTAKSIERMQRSSEASALWEAVYPELVSEKRGTWDAVTSRAEAQTLRLSMLYALLDGSSIIHVQHLKAALAVWRYADDSARMIFGTEDGGALERKIIEILMTSGKPLTKSEIRQRLSSNERKNYGHAIDWLARKGRVRETAGRWTLDVFANVQTPQTSATNAKHATPANEPQTSNVQNVQRPDVQTEADMAEVQNVQRPDVQTDNGETATLGELLDWSNANRNDWIVRSGGKVWVTTECGLTPALKRAIDANQKTLSFLLPEWDTKIKNFHAGDFTMLSEEEFYLAFSTAIAVE